jgi:hypothetical protein
VFEAVPLPEDLSKLLRMVKARVLFCPGNQSLAVRRVRLTFDEQVHVVWHEAVRKYCELIFPGGSHNLRENQVDGL